MRRREFFAACAAAPLFSTRGHASAPFPVKFKQEPPYASVMQFAEPGHDEFPGEKTAMEIEARLLSALDTGDLPFGDRLPRLFARAVRGIGVLRPTWPPPFSRAESDPIAGWKKWRASLGSGPPGGILFLARRPGSIRHSQSGRRTSRAPRRHLEAGVE